ncbi:MAG: leucine-rich repeat domain-containing protein [Oscillospiraceae bacterium]|nr:leucine-rich repeat domain-containing protein [Oscillospiraceae bacterium]
MKRQNVGKLVLLFLSIFFIYLIGASCIQNNNASAVGDRVEKNGVIYESDGSGCAVVVGVTDEYRRVFSECSGANILRVSKTVIINESVHKVNKIGESAFGSCYGLRGVAILGDVTHIGDFAFSECYDLRAINIPPSITEIGNEAFRNCWSLKSINIPPSITKIGNEAFRNCRSLESINIPPSITEIWNEALRIVFSMSAELKSCPYISPEVTTELIGFDYTGLEDEGTGRTAIRSFLSLGNIDPLPPLEGTERAVIRAALWR